MADSASTQENVPIAGIKDGIVVLKNGQYRIILEITAINFALKSEEEQNSLVFQYQGFLNSLHFPIEIVIKSKKLDLTPYINKIKKISSEQTNELIKMQTEDYIDFVGQLINLANIMKKTFYVTIGYAPLTVAKGSFIDKIFKRNTQTGNVRVSDEEFNQYAKELRQRAQTVASGLGSMGLFCKQLNTEEIISLFYNIYNPEIAGKERITETGNLSSSYVTQSKKEESGVKPEDEEEEITIDNAAIVEEASKQKEKERLGELEKTAERSVGMGQPGQVSPLAEKPGSQRPEPQKPAAQAENPPANKPAVTAVDMVNMTAPQPTAARSPKLGIEEGSKGFDKPAASVAAASPSEPPADDQAKAQPAAQKPASQAVSDDTKAIEDPDLNKDYGW